MSRLSRAGSSGGRATAAELTEAIERLDGVVAAAVRFEGDRLGDVYVAADDGHAEALRTAVAGVLRGAGLKVRAGAIRIEALGARGAAPVDRPATESQSDDPAAALPKDVAAGNGGSAAATSATDLAPSAVPDEREALEREPLSHPAESLPGSAGPEPPLEPAPPFEPEPPLERRVELEYSLVHRRFLVLHGLDLQRSESHVTCSVELLHRERSFRAECTELDSELGRARAAARATLLAAEKASSCSLALEGTQTAELFGRRYVVLSVEASMGRRFTVLSGILALDDERSIEEAAALATLHAIERFVSG